MNDTSLKKMQRVRNTVAAALQELDAFLLAQAPKEQPRKRRNLKEGRIARHAARYANK